MPLSKKQITGLATVFTLAIGGGIAMLATGQRPMDRAIPAARTQTGAMPSVSATITKIIADDIFEARAHTWVSQYTFTTVCTATPKPPCTETADIAADEKIKTGEIVHLSNIKALAATNEAQDIILPPLRPRQDRLPGPIKAHVTRLGDGDTVEVSANIWPRQHVITDIRFGQIDTPEKAGRAKCADEAILAEQASAETKRLLEGQDVMLYDVQFEKYGGRVLGTIKTKDGTDASQNLVAKGFARPYSGKTKESWCSSSPANKKGAAPKTAPFQR